MKKDFIYNQKLKNFSRNLRQKQTPSERALWSNLRNRQFLNIKFRRQVAIDKYIVDFYAEEKNLIIEIDGGSHDENKFDYDQQRQNNLESLGFRMVRFTELEVKTRMSDVLQTLENVVTSPQPSPQGEGE